MNSSSNVSTLLLHHTQSGPSGKSQVSKCKAAQADRLTRSMAKSSTTRAAGQEHTRARAPGHFPSAREFIARRFSSSAAFRAPHFHSARLAIYLLHTNTIHMAQIHNIHSTYIHLYIHTFVHTHTRRHRHVGECPFIFPCVRPYILAYVNLGTYTVGRYLPNFPGLIPDSKLVLLAVLGFPRLAMYDRYHDGSLSTEYKDLVDHQSRSPLLWLISKKIRNPSSLMPP